MSLAPFPSVPEKPNGEYRFERALGSESRFHPTVPPFQEGVASDTDVPNDFARGAYGDTAPVSANTAATSPEHVFKRAGDTMKERAHVGSASWVDASSMLSEFAEGTVQGQSAPHFVQMRNPGVPMRRENATRISDF